MVPPALLLDSDPNFKSRSAPSPPRGVTLPVPATDTRGDVAHVMMRRGVEVVLEMLWSPMAELVLDDGFLRIRLEASDM